MTTIRLIRGVTAAPLPLLIPVPYLDDSVRGTRSELPVAEGGQAPDQISTTIVRLIQGMKALPLPLLILTPIS